MTRKVRQETIEVGRLLNNKLSIEKKLQLPLQIDVLMELVDGVLGFLSVKGQKGEHKTRMDKRKDGLEKAVRKICPSKMIQAI
eukprot:g42414.t1